MSNQLAIAAITAVLRNLLSSRLNLLDQSVLGSVAVTALPPDRVLGENGNERSQLNLFMYHAAPNLGWANVGMASRDADGQRLTNPPLALDLHYLLMAYGAAELHADALLGFGMQVLHENPILTRNFIRQTLVPTSPSAEIAMLAASELADQIELVKICPVMLNTEELSKLWTAFQSRYRPTAAYRLSVVLIESKHPTRAPLPVLTQGKEDHGPQAFADLSSPYPIIESVEFPDKRIAALIGDTVTVKGRNLNRVFDVGAMANTPQAVSVRVEFHHPQREVPPIAIANLSESAVSFQLTDETKYPVGVYAMSLTITSNNDPTKKQETNRVPLMIAPRITDPMPMTVERDKPAHDVDPNTPLRDATITLNCAPRVWPNQHVTLVLGQQEAQTKIRTGPTNTLTFKFTQMAAGAYRVRLRVDGIESLLIQRSTNGKPQFDETQKVILQ